MKGIKIGFYLDELAFMKTHFNQLSNAEMLDHINENRPESQQIKLSALRAKLYEMGLKKQEKPECWAEEEIKVLIENYKHTGNKDIAAMLNNRTTPTRKFTKGKIWKKMDILGLKRTPEHLEAIRQKNIANGCYGPEPGSRGYAPGQKFIWLVGRHKRLMIKLENGWKA